MVLLLLLTFALNLKGQSVLKQKEYDVEPIEKFSFLIDGNKLTVASTVRLEQMDILLGMDFSYETGN